MKKVLTLLLLLLCWHSSSNAAIFDNSVIKFIYPSEYEEVEINNAPHMIVKFVSNDSAISVSRWTCVLDEKADAWDDNLFAQHSKGVPGAEYILIEKMELQINNEKLRAIKTYANLDEGGIRIGIISYLFVKNGDLFVVGYMRSDTLTKMSNSESIEKILTGLTIKEKTKFLQNFTVADFEKAWLDRLKQTNQTLPMKVDDATTLYGVTIVGKTILLKYYVDSDFVKFLDNNWAVKYKEKTILNMFSSVPNAETYISYFAKSSIIMRYLFYDENDSLIRILQITPNDFK